MLMVIRAYLGNGFVTKGRALLILLSYFTSSLCDAQQVRFKESLGGLSPDYGYCARQTYDKGYIAVGSTANYSYGETDVYVVKTDSNGTVLWQKKHFGTPNIDIGRYVEETKDSSLIITGFTNNTPNNGYDVLLLRLDRRGDSLWSKTYGGTGWDFAYSVHQTFDGGFIIAGGTYSYGAGGEDFWLIKTDINGDTLWTKTYGGSLDDEARSVRQTKDSGYVIIGTTKSFGDSAGEVYVVKTNSIGDTLWTKRYGGAKENDGNDIIECQNGDFAFCGRTYSFIPVGSSRFYLLRADKNGSLLWSYHSYSLATDSGYQSLEGIVETASGNLSSIGVKFGQFTAGNGDAYLLMAHSDGSWYFGPTYGTSGAEAGYSVAITRDKGYIICGFTDSISTGFGEPNMFLIKTDSTGYLPPTPFLLSTKTIQNSILNSVSAYPNPFSSELNIVLNTAAEFNPSDFRFSIRDISGRLCYTNYTLRSITNNSLEIKLNRGNLQQGVYFIQYCLGQQIIGVSKVVIE